MIIFTSGLACASNILVSNNRVSMRKQRPAKEAEMELVWNKTERRTS